MAKRILGFAALVKLPRRNCCKLSRHICLVVIILGLVLIPVLLNIGNSPPHSLSTYWISNSEKLHLTGKKTEIDLLIKRLRELSRDISDPQKNSNHSLSSSTQSKAAIEGGTQSKETFLEMILASLSQYPGINNSLYEPSKGGRYEMLQVSSKALIDREKYMMLKAVAQNFTLMESEEPDNFVNLHRYSYIHDSAVCSDAPDVIIAVHSKYNNFVKRANIRQTWGYNKTVRDVRFKTVFMLGEPNPVEQKTNKTTGKSTKDTKQRLMEELTKIGNESKQFGDIVMGNFTDTYRNLTVKHVMTLGWVLSHCPNASYIVKADDDTIVNTYGVASYIKEGKTTRDNLLVCRVLKANVALRGKKRKWCVSMREYPFPLYPDTCMGFGVLMSHDVVQQLYDTTSYVRTFWIDDVYITGIVAWSAGIRHTTVRGGMAPVTIKVFQPKYANSMFILGPSYHSLPAFWGALVDAQKK